MDNLDYPLKASPVKLANRFTEILLLFKGQDVVISDILLRLLLGWSLGLLRRSFRG